MSVFRKTYKGRDGVTEKAAIFHVEFRDHLERVQRVPGFDDKASTKELERKLRTLAALRASGAPLDETMRRWTENLPRALRDRLAEIGLITSQQVAALRPLSELVESWAKHLRAKGTGEEHVRLVTARALFVIDGTDAKVWTDLDSTRVEDYLRTERETGDKISARTSNFYLQAARQFIRWAIRTGLATDDPLRVLEPMNAERDRRRERRALTPEELQGLLDKTTTGPTRDGMTGPERALLYRTAAETGLRCGELSALLVADLDLAAKEKASVRVRAATAKNGREAWLPLRTETAEMLAAFVEKRLPLAKVFATPKNWLAAKCLRADLAAAGVKDRDEAGRVVDFHALRTTFCTSLARVGVAMQVAQKLMRHSTPNLTANVYTVLGRDDERAAVAKLPRAAKPKEQSATGTDGRDARGNVWQACWQEDTRKGAIPCDSMRQTVGVVAAPRAVLVRSTRGVENSASSLDLDRESKSGRRSLSSNEAASYPRGGVTEWSNVPVSKTGVRATVPRVRIPTPPPSAARGDAAGERVASGSPRRRRSRRPAPGFGRRAGARREARLCSRSTVESSSFDGRPAAEVIDDIRRRDAGAVERARLESACTSNGT